MAELQVCSSCEEMRVCDATLKLCHECELIAEIVTASVGDGEDKATLLKSLMLPPTILFEELEENADEYGVKKSDRQYHGDNYTGE
jgi:hypothetical protein